MRYGAIVRWASMVHLLAASVAGAACPLAPVADAGLAPVLQGHGVMTGGSPQAILFRSKLARDDDGAPTAYHRAHADDRRDTGLDHICDGGDVLEFRDGRLVPKYWPGGSIGELGGTDPATGIGRSRLCKRDYIAIRDAGFPACGPGRLCMRWYGVVVEPRSCGYNRADDMGCGRPILQVDRAGNPTPFYLTANILRRPGSPPDSRVQSDYADASRIPFIVMPGGLELPAGMRWEAGDLAVVAANGRIAYAVIGDSGPRNKLGEGSRELLRRLGMEATEDANAATTLLFPGTASRVRADWPLSPARIRSEARLLLGGAEGIAAWRRCPGLERLD